ncbi:related to putative multidrug transporter Mfs1.1 (major facilitator family protein) [Phialocephala subalpina]|uniref:Related to putative multidrug transporter Mfs1.1 (Major facilitator family protein) n=1 Tax=Phialocephala subalpina TaxID=576137 RepID=A0A1L7X010_9HELO|nr:related to putative multidrug transporter Mfs1.1 (major facilitator family protein) [Phialocephala subalpina]
MSLDTKGDPDSKMEETSNRASRELAPAIQPAPETKPEPENGDSSKLDEPEAQVRDWRFYMVFAALSITGLLSAAEATIISTALPTIIKNLDVGSNYAWVANAYFLTSMVVTPLYGQLANIWGRRWPMICSVVLLIIGSAICGWATNGAMLIAGRAIQGFGGGGINMLVELITCDLVPLRERSKFMGIIMGTFTVGTAVGPIVGGIIVQGGSWRWVFWLNLPIGGFALGFLLPFLQVHFTKESSLIEKLKRIDWIGNLILAPSLVSIMIALTDAGTKAPWSSWRIILPLVLGFAGLILFQVYEASSWCVEPTVPMRLFENRTSLAAYTLTLLHIITSVWTIYFFPLYFQSVLGSSPARSGVQILPTFLILLPFAVVSGLVVTKMGRYRPVHHVGFAVMVIGFGLSTLLNAGSSTAEWVIYQGIIAAGSGIIVSSLLPAIQAALSDNDAAASTALFTFVRSFGAIWGITIPVAVFNNQFDKLLYKIQDPATRALLADGQAYEHASRAFIYAITEPVRSQVIGVYSDSLKTVWQVGIAMAGLGFIVVFVEKELKMRTELTTEYGLKEKPETAAEGSPEAAV